MLGLNVSLIDFIQMLRANKIEFSNIGSNSIMLHPPDQFFDLYVSVSGYTFLIQQVVHDASFDFVTLGSFRIDECFEEVMEFYPRKSNLRWQENGF